MRNLRTFYDDLGREVVIPHPPKRIISLCPSQTCTLFELGLENRMVGRTRFCIHPKEKVKNVARVGGTKQVRMEEIHALNPDLIIGEKEENTPEMVEELSRDYPVFVTDVKDWATSLRMVESLGLICGVEERAAELLAQLSGVMDQIPGLEVPLTVAYFIWKDPWMVAGKDTFIQDMLARLGFENVFLLAEGRYPQVSPEQIQKADPQVVLLSSEPYPFQEKHLQEIQDLLPAAQVMLVDGEAFSWYGSQMLYAGKEFARVMEKCQSLQTSNSEK